MKPTIVEACARAAHEANRAYCIATGDDSQLSWDTAEEWQRKAAREGVLFALTGATSEEQHESWCAAKRSDGWSFGVAKDAAAKTHPCLVAYADLPAQQRAKDGIYGDVVRAVAKAISGIPSEDGHACDNATLKAAIVNAIGALQKSKRLAETFLVNALHVTKGTAQ